MNRRKTIASPDRKSLRLTGYDKVAHLVPDKSDVTQDFIGVVARFQILGSPEFRLNLDKVDNRDPTIMNQLLTQPSMGTDTQNS